MVIKELQKNYLILPKNKKTQAPCHKHNYVVDLHRCPKCTFTCKNETGLKIHMNARHKEATNCLCPSSGPSEPPLPSKKVYKSLK